VKRLLLLASVLATLTACASLGLAQPRSFDEQLAQAYGVHTAVVSSLATAVTTGAVNVATATKLEAQAQAARGMLDAARLAEQANNTAGAQSDLTLAMSALTALQSFLNSQMPPGASPAAGAAP
jgi:hypothetical protein